MRSPFKFLDSYGPKDQHIFFGRETETEQLVQLIFQTPLLLLYGMSGTGKTSLVQCGLSGKFHGPDWLPLWIRRGDDINQSLREAIGKVWPQGQPMKESLKDQVTLLYRFYLRPVYLIFDQFEELFILGDEEHKEEDLFTENLRRLIEAGLPCKVILSLREEFIGQLYRMEQAIPSIYDFRLRVEPMGRVKVREVISRSCEVYNIRLENPAKDPDLICDNLSSGKSGIQLPFLQIYLDQLYKEDFQRSYPEDTQLSDPLKPLLFETREIQEFGNIEKVLEGFLREQERELELVLREINPGKTPPNAVRQILNAFVTEEGTKQPIRYLQEGELIKPAPEYESLFPALPEAALSTLLQRLISNRLLRQETQRLELSHDSLAALIDRGRSDEQRRLNQLLSRIVLAEKYFEVHREYLGPGVLGQIDELFGQLKTRLEKRHLDFIEASRRNQQEELEKERRLREKAEKNAQTARIRTRLAGVLSLVAVALAIAAGVSYTQAKTSEKETKEALEKNLRQQAEAKARELLSYGDSYYDLGRKDFACQSYSAGRDSVQNYPGSEVYKTLSEKIKAVCKK